MTIVAPLKDREIFLGDVEMQIAADDSIQVSVAQVFELLQRTLDPASVEPLRTLAEPGVFAPIERFGELGLPLAFNSRSLELSVAIPPSARSRQSIGLADLDREMYGEFATPEAFTTSTRAAGRPASAIRWCCWTAPPGSTASCWNPRRPGTWATAASRATAPGWSMTTSTG
jgi:hypothetical protein